MPKNKGKSIKKFLTIASLFISLGMFFVLANDAHAIQYTAQIGFGAFSKTIDIGPDSIGLYITEIYKYSVGVVGILATIVMMWGGVLYITSGGDKTKAGEGMKWIEGAVTGLVLVMTSYMILNFVNPDLVVFKSIKIDPIKATPAPITGNTQGKCHAMKDEYITTGASECTTKDSTAIYTFFGEDSHVNGNQCENGHTGMAPAAGCCERITYKSGYQEITKSRCDETHGFFEPN